MAENHKAAEAADKDLDVGKDLERGITAEDSTSEKATDTDVENVCSQPIELYQVSSLRN
jgi:hypothetical protein